MQTIGALEKVRVLVYATLGSYRIVEIIIFHYVGDDL